MRLQYVEVPDPYLSAVAFVDAHGVTVADVSGDYVGFNRMAVGKPGEPICWIRERMNMDAFERELLPNEPLFRQEIRDLGGACWGDVTPDQVPFLWDPAFDPAHIHTDFLAFLKAVDAECAKGRERQALIERRQSEIEAECRRMCGEDE